MTRAVVVVIGVLALAAGAAYADQTIYAAPVDMFVGGDVTISQGEKVTFTNGDAADHDVTAKDNSGGKPLFQSAKTGPGQSNPVVGVEALKPGTYNYICSIHNFMTGTITVTGSGTPSGGGGSGGQTQNSSADTTPATLSAKVLDKKRSTVRKRRSLQLSVTTNEPITAAIKAVSGSTTVASGKATLTKAGSKKLSIKLTKAGLNKTKRGTVKLRVTVNAKDGAGNASSASASGKLR